jgi:GT2 family glycosyltransferase
VDLEGPLADLSLRSERLGIAYRSLLAVARLDGEPLGAVAVPVRARGRVPGDWLAEVLCCELEPELRDALARRGLEVPESLPRDGIKKGSRDHDSRVTARSVTVVVTASHDPMLLERCLQSVFACDDPDFEVIVVDQQARSRAATRMLDERFDGESRLRCVEDAGAGLSRARNVGLAHADGDVVMFAGDDVIVDAGWISRCRAAFDRDGDVACVTGLILPPELDNERDLRCERFAGVVNGFRPKAFRQPRGRATHPFFYYTPGAMGSGANTALRADVVRQLGGFDATLGPGTPALGGDDMDVYVRLLHAGYTVVYDPSVIVWQAHRDGVAHLRRRVLREGVSLGAALTKQLAAAPKRRTLLRAVPAGMRYEMNRGAASDTAERPLGLDWLRRLGVALGPAAYAASRLRLALMPWAQREASREQQRTATRADRALLAVTLAACLLAPMLVAIGAPGGLRFPAVLAVLCLAPGTALVTALGRRGASAELGLVIGASLGVAAVLAQTMLWLGAWWPRAFLYLLAVTCLVPLLARYRELAPRARARGSEDGDPAADDAPREALATWVTEVELAVPVPDLRPPRNPSGARNGRARVLARLHGQPIGFVELPLREGTLAARDLVAAIDAQLSVALAAHLERDGLPPAQLTPEGLPIAESPPCAAAGFYGESEPFVSVILSADGNGAGALEPSLEAALGVDYPAYEVVVARTGCSNDGDRRPELRHPRLHYVYEQATDPWKARRRAVRAAGGDVLAFTDHDVVVDANWVRALVRGLTPAARVGCVTGPVLDAHGAAPDTGVNFAVSRDALLAVGGLDEIPPSVPTGASAHDALIARFLLAGWAVSHEPSAMAWPLAARDGARAGMPARVANRLASSAPVQELRQWLGRERQAVSGRSLPQPAALHAIVLAAAGVAWALSLRGADLSRTAGLGLLNAMPATYFIAVGLLLAGFIASLTRPELPTRLLWLYALALILVLHATTALLYDEPRYPWTFKHLGVIALIVQAGAVDRSVDIYNNWPGFFALVAWLSAATGLSAVSYAAWAQVFFNLANVVALRFALRGVTTDERLLWTASLLFLLGNWLGQDYLAPQAFAFLLSLVVLGLCLRCAPAAHPPGSRVAHWWAGVLDGLRRRILRGEPVEEPLDTAALSPAAAVVVGGLCYLAIVVSHQLTPVVLLAGVLWLALIARRVPLWVPLAMGVVEAWWLWRAWPYLSLHFSLFDPAPSSSAAPSGYSIGDGLPGLALVAYAVRAELLVLVILAAVGLVRRLRNGHWDLAAATLVVAPLVVVLQAYGGEGRYRVYLFALPWLCFFAAAALSPTGARPRAVRHRASLALASACLGTCLLLAYFGLELMNRVDPDDIAAARWFERHAPSDSLLVGATTNFPLRVSARYPTVYDPDYPGPPSITEHAVYRSRRLGAADLPRIERTLRGFGSPHTFLTLTASQERYARLYGLLRPGSLQSLDRALRASPDFRLVYRRGTSSIFVYRERHAEAIR